MRSNNKIRDRGTVTCLEQTPPGNHQLSGDFLGLPGHLPDSPVIVQSAFMTHSVSSPLASDWRL